MSGALAPAGNRLPAFALHQVWPAAVVARVPSRTLAYVGDSVYELTMRLHLVQGHCDSSGKLHDSVVQLVNTSRQAQLFETLFPQLPAPDQELLRTWRNAKMPQRWSGATRGEYARATAFEAWVGYLFLSGQQERLEETMKLSLTAPVANSPCSPTEAKKAKPGEEAPGES